MNVQALDAATMQIVGQRDIGTGTPVHMAMKFDRANAAWVARCVGAFVAATSAPADCANGPDKLTSRVSGNDHEVFLTMLNFRPDAGGSIVLTEDQARALLPMLAG